MQRYNYNFLSKIYFYFTYIYHIFLIPFECKKGTLTIFVVQIIWIARVITKWNIIPPKKFLSSEFVTKYGRYTIDPGLVNTIIISPAFEKLDLEIFLSLIKKELSSRKKVLVLDIGAHVGKYTVAIGNAFKDFDNIRIYAFEPDSQEFSKDSFFYLKKNIKANNINTVKLFNIGLGSRNTYKPNEIGIKTRRLDDMVNSRKLKQYDTVFMKIDVETDSKDVLIGAYKFMHSSSKIILLVEDYFHEDVIHYLKKNFIFYKKLSPYNSFWIKI